MPINCCIKGCTNNTKKNKDIKFHLFPQLRSKMPGRTLSIERRKQWLAAIKRKEINTKIARVCSTHFISGKSANLSDNLNPDWVPSLHLTHSKSKQCGRSERHKKRIAEKAMRKTSVHTMECNVAAAALSDKLSPDVVPSIKLGYTICHQNSNSFKRRKLSLDIDPLAEAEIIPFETVLAEGDSFEAGHVIQMLHKQLAEKNELLQEYQTADGEGSSAEGNVEEHKNAITQCNEGHTKMLQHYEKLLKQKNETIEKLKLNEEVQQTALYAYEEKLKDRDKVIDNLRKQLCKQNLSVESFKDNDAKVNYITGLPKFAILESLFDYVKGDLKGVLLKGVNVSEAFVMVLLKLRLDLPFTYMSYKYGMSVSTVSRIFNINLIAMSTKIGTFIRWPNKTAMSAIGYKFTAILSFFEMSVEAQPNASFTHPETMPSIKTRHNTMKYLIAISPTGGIIFASKGYDGKCSEKSIVDGCGLLDNIEHGDIILSDNGKTVNQLVVDNGAKSLMPIVPPSEDIEDIQMTKQLIKVRCHVDHLLRQKYLILSSKHIALGHTKKRENELFYDHIARLCCALANLCPSIIKSEQAL